MITVVPYDTRWPLMFEKEKSEIVEALGGNCLCIHHIGSTAIPGLSAKPKIDIIAAARDKQSAIQALERIGYQHRGEWGIPFQIGLAKRGDPDVNLHLFLEDNHAEVELNLKFRDYLRSHPEARDEYAMIKEEILKDEASHQKSGQFPLYTQRKAPFIEKILRKIGYNRLRALHANNEYQWNAIKQLCPDHKIVLENHEHLVLYRGVDVIGYADIQLHPCPAKISLFKINDNEARPFFEEFLKSRI